MGRCVFRHIARCVFTTIFINHKYSCSGVFNFILPRAERANEYRKSPCIRPLKITPTLRVHAQSGEVNTFVSKWRPCPCIHPGMPATPVHVQILIPNTYCYPYSKYMPCPCIRPGNRGCYSIRPGPIHGLLR